MARGIAFIALALLAFTMPLAAQAHGEGSAPASSADAVPWRVLTGELTHADHAHYRDVTFDLPAGVTRLTIRFSYGGKEERSVIDLGLADPQRFRGWSGGSRDGFTLSIEEATPGYLAGPLPAGRWRLILGAPNIRPGARAPFEARIFIEQTDRVTEFADMPINPQPGWYRGDLHIHSGNSDGRCTSQTEVRLPCPVARVVATAAARGLDFMALTDHNTTAHFAALRALQPAYDRMLLVPGREITTFFGHANVFGPTAFLDFRMTQPSWAQARQWIEPTLGAGGLVSINHPGIPSGESCMGCGWQVKDLPAGTIGAVEIINGGTLAGTGMADGPLQGFAFWQSLLDRGEHVTAIGGSDSHDPDLPAITPGAIGSPTTVVYMPELSVKGLIAGIRAGRVFIDIDGTRDRLLDVSAQSGDARATMGETLIVPRGQSAQVTIHVEAVTAGRAELIVDGKLAKTLPLSGGEPLTARITGDGARHWLRVDIRDPAGRLLLVSNALYLAAR